MHSNSNKYREYFDVDERYFPCIDDSAIDAGAPWDNTYPHSSFIDMLVSMERALARLDKKTLWIEGAYGTGKSQCAFALKKILEVPEEELCAYWNRYEALKKKPDLLEKLIGHKRQGIVTAHRYASGGIMSPRDLFFAVQESVKNALVKRNIGYLGENTLKEGVIAWIDQPANKRYFNDLLQEPEWKSLFSQSSADEVLAVLRKSGEVKTLIDNIFRLADKVGITALNLDADRLIAWLSDIIDRNNIKIVLVWDEFSDYFKNNRESLSEFQKLAALVQNKPFYFIVVTHEPQQIYVSDNDKGNQSKVSDRFISCTITLPDNIAFNLIGHAFNVKPAAKTNWDIIADDLNSRVSASRNEVMRVAKIVDPQVMKDIMPLHPMAALLLKNIASAFKSNQRSMFDFIKTSNTDDVKAFQWFIENTDPYDDHPLLTVDMLWDFFYEKGRENLDPSIRIILDTFPQQPHLREDEKAVLKAILIMQAIDQRLGGTIDLFKATEQNLSYVFEGISSGLDVSCKNIAKQLKEKGILIANPINTGGRYVYAVAVLAGDQAKIDSFTKTVRQNSATSKLVVEGELATVLPLSALKLRFESESGTGKITPVTVADFTRTINSLRDKAAVWKFQAVIAFAKDEAEAAALRRMIREAVADEQYKNIVFIDTLSTPLGAEAFERYVDHAAMSMYYSGSNNSSAKDSESQAKQELRMGWRDRIYDGPFIIYTYSKQDGEKLGKGKDVASILQSIVTMRFEDAFDFARGLTENQLKLTQGKQSAKCGITQNTSGVVVNIEKSVLPTVWKVEQYWENPSFSALPISKIKIALDKLIQTAFVRDGQISIGEVYDFLETEYGFAPCNLSAFLAGFLLKEYGGEPFRYCDSSGGHEPMTADKLAEMLGNYIGKSPKPTYIVKMTAEEMAFYELTEKAWRITPNSCSSASQAVRAISGKMRELGLPAWCLEDVDAFGVYGIVEKYLELVQKEGNEAHKKAIEIGKIALSKPTLPDTLTELLTKSNCQQGMREFLLSFEAGKALELAKIIGAEGRLLSDIQTLFEVKYSCLWDKHTGEDEIRRLMVEYDVAKESNTILNAAASSLRECFKEWREQLKFIGVSFEALRTSHPALAKVFDTLLKICQSADILPDQCKVFLQELTDHGAELCELLSNSSVFSEIYKPYLEGFSEIEIGEIKSKLPTGMFSLSRSECNTKVRAVAEKFRENQLRTKLFRIWKDKVGSDIRNPREWSSRYRTPILSCVSASEFGSAKQAFDTLNRTSATDAEIKTAIAFLETTRLFESLSDTERLNAAFVQDIIGEYSSLLPDADKVRTDLERLSVDTYDWRDNPSVKNRVRLLAEAEYHAGGSDGVLKKIDAMDDAQLKQYLKRLARDNMTVGIEILTDSGD